MRFAICIFGLHPDHTWKVIKPSRNRVHECFKHFLIDPNEKAGHQVDIFLHSFSIDQKDNMLKEYNPTVALFEHKKEFKSTIKNGTDDHCQKGYGLNWHSIVQIIEYGRYQSVKLMKQYSDQNNVEYDFVMSMRSDLLFLRPFSFDDLDSNKFYAAKLGRNNSVTLEKGHIATTCYVSNSAKIVKLTDIHGQHFMKKYIDEGFNNHHTFMKKHIDTFTEIEYKFNGKDNGNRRMNRNMDFEVQRFIYKWTPRSVPRINVMDIDISHYHQDENSEGVWVCRDKTYFEKCKGEKNGKIKPEPEIKTEIETETITVPNSEIKKVEMEQKIQNKIPKIIHQIWIGDKPPPNIWIDTWKKDYMIAHPEFKYMYWDNTAAEKLLKSWPNIRKKFYTTNIQCCRADLLRYVILYTYGGIYIDADSAWVNKKDLTELIERTDINGMFAAPHSKDNSTLANGVIGCTKNNAVILNIINDLNTMGPRRFRKKLVRFGVSNITGPTIFDRHVKGKITVFPAEYFYPIPWHGISDVNLHKKMELPEDSFMFQYGLTTNNLNYENKIMFCHIPKCGGTYVTSQMKKYEKTTKLVKYAVSQHRIMKCEKSKYSKYYRFTSIRDPVKRVISAYFYIVNGIKNTAPRHLDIACGYVIDAFKKYGITDIISFLDNFQKMYNDKFKPFVLDPKRINKNLDDFHKGTTRLITQGFYPQYLFIMDDNYELLVDDVVDINDIDKFLKNKFGIEPGEKVNTHDHTNDSYMSYVTPEHLKMIKKIYAKDYKYLFGIDVTDENKKLEKEKNND